MEKPKFTMGPILPRNKRAEKFTRRFEKASAIDVEPCAHGISDRPCETCDPRAYANSATFRHLGTILEWRHLGAKSENTIVRLHCYTCHLGAALEVLHGAIAMEVGDPVYAARVEVRKTLAHLGCPHHPPRM